MKLILQAIKALFRKIEASRTHWEEVEEVEILTETTVTISEDNSYELLQKTTQLTVGQTYFVILDGVSYECVAWYSDSDEDVVIIGNGAICGGEGGNSEPFSCDSHSSGDIYLNTEKAGTYTISISTKENIIHKLDKKYLPDEVIESIDNAQTTANNAQTTANNAQTTANNAQTTANNAQTAANNAQTTANSKMNANNPVGTGSFSMGRKPGSAVGNRSHAEGYWTTASGVYSHAEGNSTTVLGSNSHAEGYWTTASSDSQHVQGRNNIEDSQNKYAHIVGNGVSSDSRSNAHTLDWKGNAWYAGDVYIGSTSGTNKDEGSKKLATEEYVDSKQVQSDWNQNDSTAADYVKNRPFYNETKTVTVENVTDAKLEGFPAFVTGETVNVNVDGVEHSLVAYYDEDEGVFTIGDIYSSIEAGEGQLGWQFWSDGKSPAHFYATEAHTISYLGVFIYKIDDKFVNLDGLVRTFDYHFKEFWLYKTLYNSAGDKCMLYTCSDFILPDQDSQLFGFMSEFGFSKVDSVDLYSCFIAGFIITPNGVVRIERVVLGTDTSHMETMAADNGYTYTTNPNA